MNATMTNAAPAITVSAADDLDHTLMALADLGAELFAGDDGAALLASIDEGGDPEVCAQHLEYLAKLIRVFRPAGEPV